MITLTDHDFLEKVSESKFLAIKMWAEWCQPCKQLSPIFAEMADMYENEISFAAINVDENPEAVAHFGIRGVPAILFIKNGKVVETLTGNQPRPRIEYTLSKLVD